MLQEFMTSNDITKHNFENTRHVKHQNLSCIDHIYSNVPNKIIYVKTHNNNFSDHSITMAIYTSKEHFYTPKFIKMRNFRNLNKEALILTFKQSQINTAFNYSDPNSIADIIQLEMNTIINTLVPYRITQYICNYTPYITDKIKRELKHTHYLLNKAIRTHGINDWREFKNHNNMVNKQNKIHEKEYMKNKFKSVNNKYKIQISK